MSADSYRVPVTIGIMMATLMGTLDTTIANVALPHMQGNLSASPEQITWVLTSYIVAAAVATPISGWMASRFGLKQMLMASVAAFTLTSMLCGLAATLPEMVAFRIAQGISGAALIPLSQAVLLNINPPERHAQAMSIWSMGTILGPVLGPVLGGYLTEDASWRWCFYINLPVGAVSMLLLWVFLPSGAARPRRFDFLGFGSLTVAIAALQLMLDRGPSQDWFSAREIWIDAVLAAIGFWIFLTHTLTARHPLFDPSLARDRNLITATVFGFLTSVLMFSSLTLLPLLMQTVLGYPVFLAGLLSMPRGVAMMATMLIMGRMMNMLDLRLILGAGLAICAVAFWQMTRFDLGMSARQLLMTGMLQGGGQGMIFVPLSTLAFATVDPSLRADASAIYNLMRQIAGSMGISLMQALAAGNGQRMHAALAAHIDTADPVVRAGLPPNLSPDTVSGALALNAEITRQATMVAYLDNFRVMLVLALVLLPLLLLLRPPKRPQAVKAVQARPSAARAA
ncbi:MAG: EmrB/QacA family drug resistance transporter [Phenylobacterium sp.]|nr:EmrB/QacA family drug resistance transporter [Phenylobacterium sp.]